MSITDWPGSSALGIGLQPYRYEPLCSRDSIRLLVLEPAESVSMPLQGSILQIRRHEETAKLDSCRSYSALSYVWGRPIFSQQILLKSDSTEYNSYLLITENVKDILKSLRKAHKPRYLWIDAICLDQQNDEEKAEQIPLMGEIYSQAHKVHIWLGSDNEDETAKVFVFFRLLVLFPAQAEATDIFDGAEAAASQIKRFFQRPWFQRRWILQEAALAQYGIMYSGGHSIPYTMFVSACRKLQSSVYGREEYGVQMTLTLSETKKNLFALLWMLDRSICSDKRDRIAALYGFLPAGSRLSLEYNTGYMNIYKQHAIALINSPFQDEMMLHLFQFGPLQPRQGSPFSSWVPDWSNQRDTGIKCLLDTPNGSEYRQESSVPRAFRAYFKWRQNIPWEKISGNFASELKLWKKWLFDNPKGFPLQGESKLTYQSDNIKPPCTLLTTRKDEAGCDLLNLRWVNDWAGSYGRTISKVVTVGEGFGGGYQFVVDCFRPLQENLYIQSAGRGSNNFPKLALLVEYIMTWYERPSLSTWEGKERRLVVYEALRTMMTGKHPESKSAATVFSKSQDNMSQTIEGVITDLGAMMYENKCVLLEIEELEPQFAQDSRPEFDYAFGPLAIKKGMLLVPLASHLPDYGSSSNRVTWAANYTDFDIVQATRYKQSDWCTITLNNLIVVNPLDEVYPISAPSVFDKLRQMGRHSSGEVDRAIPPLRATYVCPCLGVIYRHSWFIGRDTKEHFVSPTLDALSSYWRNVGRIYSQAAKEGRPPPFTIDLV
ncbi:heterokaryon incompatibility protein-domain-containing protein [Xylogone sp. PMI_703]|nr:heterokaryon incompatibility protein-domain-containing protein [Xylogone sp. PMI_703]